ncbi:MAG TPA: PIG-L family deacetylase [Actinomycetes bacterium]|nr:PIG-L family deacetylase [Actinomycetes bacterium]
MPAFNPQTGPVKSGAELGTVLGVWAHPDDETYLSSGLMAEAVDAGSRVVCVTATRGEGGSFDPVRWPPETMGEVRTRELERCLAILGVTEHIFLDIPDVDWHTPLPNSGADAVAEVMRAVQPDTVLTFGPDGMTNHEGHKSVSQWTTDAFAAFAPPGSSLYYAVVARTWADRFVPLLDSVGVYREGAKPPIVDDERLDIDIVLEGRMLERKLAAMYEHESQMEVITELFGRDNMATAFASESFGRSPVPPGGQP